MHVSQATNDKWVVWTDDGPCGPYDTKAEAESDMRGLARFEKHKDRPGFITSDKPKVGSS